MVVELVSKLVTAFNGPCAGRIVDAAASDFAHASHDDTPLALAAETAVRPRSLLTEIIAPRDANESLRRETHELIAACRQRPA
jgi:hypothetical protein